MPPKGRIKARLVKCACFTPSSRETTFFPCSSSYAWQATAHVFVKSKLGQKQKFHISSVYHDNARHLNLASLRNLWLNYDLVSLVFHVIS